MSPELKTNRLDWLATCCWESTCLASCPRSPALGWHPNPAMPSFLRRRWDPSWGPHAYTASPLPTKLLPQVPSQGFNVFILLDLCDFAIFLPLCFVLSFVPFMLSSFLSRHCISFCVYNITLLQNLPVQNRCNSMAWKTSPPGYFV